MGNDPAEGRQQEFWWTHLEAAISEDSCPQAQAEACKAEEQHTVVLYHPLLLSTFTLEKPERGCRGVGNQNHSWCLDSPLDGMRHQVKTNETQEDPTVHLASEHGEESVELHFVRIHRDISLKIPHPAHSLAGIPRGGGTLPVSLTRQIDLTSSSSSCQILRKKYSFVILSEAEVLSERVQILASENDKKQKCPYNSLHFPLWKTTTPSHQKRLVSLSERVQRCHSSESILILLRMESTHVASVVSISIDQNSSFTLDVDGHHLILLSRVVSVRRSMLMEGGQRLPVRIVADISVMYFMGRDSLLPILVTAWTPSRWSSGKNQEKRDNPHNFVIPSETEGSLSISFLYELNSFLLITSGKRDSYGMTKTPNKK